ncbi:hypothetical protein JCM6882_000684 [Rhodosporidiobolus microsporus]
MCGIVFGIRSSASYRSSGYPSSLSAANSPAASTDSAPSPSSSDPLGLSNDWREDPEYGMKLPDGSRPERFLDANETWDGLIEAVRGRGPDATNSLIKHVSTTKSFHFEMRFHASILHMRGDSVTLQPFVADNGDVFLWNGEVFDGLEVSPHENDGQKLFDRIQAYGPSSFFAAIRDVEGPYAFVYYQASMQRLYFARDPLGRRSLLYHPPTPTSPFFFLASCAPGGDFPLQEWEEISCEAVHCYHLLDLKGKSWTVDGKRGLSSYPRYPRSLGLSEDILIYPFDRLNSSLPKPGSLIPLTRSLPPQPVVTSQLALLLQSFLSELERAVRSRVATVPPVPPPPEARIAVLFSGGLDCTTIALIADRVLPEGEAIDLINVAFENPRKIKAKQEAQGGGKKGKKGGKGKGNAAKGEEEEEEAMEVDDSVPPTPEPSSDVPEDPVELDTSPSSSGSTQPMSVDASSIDPPSPDAPPPPVNSSVYDVPDRLTARSSWEELKRLRPKRRWNLVEVNVPYQEMLKHRQTVIDLMKPQNTVMDLSIGIAFWFAARGQGILSQYSSDPSTSSADLPPPTPHHSRARVLFSGLGADELLGGYSRHRKAFNQPPPPAPPHKALSSLSLSSSPTMKSSLLSSTKSSSASPPAAPVPASTSPSTEPQPPHNNWSAFLSELQLDLDRLPTRNLGRDDRIVSSHGKEARYPFLAGHVVDFLARQPVWLKADLRLPEGSGDKMLLRLLAKKLGLSGVASLRKRAIHFGAATAKIEMGSGKAKGHDLLE